VNVAVKSAVECGYRLIDCAFIYGNETEVGDALTRVMRDGTARREDLFVISKVIQCVIIRNVDRILV